MTIEHRPSTNGRVHTNDSKPAERREFDAREKEDGGGLSKLIMPLLLMAVALFVLRRLNKGNVV
jgi:hypothetical protein